MHFYCAMLGKLSTYIIYLPGDPATLKATQGRNICRLGGVDTFRDKEDPVDVDVDEMLPFPDFLHTKWTKTSFPSRIRLSLSSPNHCSVYANQEDRHEKNIELYYGCEII